MSSRILWITDVHHPAVSGTHYPRSEQAMVAFESMIARLRAIHALPDLLAISGDLVNRGSARIDDLEYFKTVLEGWNIPYIVCPGNHDLTPSKRFAEMYPGMEDMEPGPLENTHFGRVFGVEGLRGETTLEDVRILSFALRDEDPDGQLDWLESSLRSSHPSIVFGHYPVLTSRAGGFCSTWGYARIAAVRDRLRSILEASAGDFLLYCAGHQHINSIVRTTSDATGAVRDVASSGFTQVVSGALGTSPYTFRWIDVDGEHISLETGFLAGFDGWINEAMNPDKATDDEHPDNNTYFRGLPAERDIALY